MKPLRNAHRQIWLVLSVLLPAGIVCSWLVIPGSSPAATLSRPAQQLLPVIQAKGEYSAHCIYIRSDTGGTAWQAEWKNKLPLTVPSAVIYQTDGRHTDINKAYLVGRIEANGDYVFKLQAASTSHKEINLLLYDFIHEKLIDSFNIKTDR